MSKEKDLSSYYRSSKSTEDSDGKSKNHTSQTKRTGGTKSTQPTVDKRERSRTHGSSDRSPSSGSYKNHGRENESPPGDRRREPHRDDRDRDSKRDRERDNDRRRDEKDKERDREKKDRDRDGDKDRERSEGGKGSRKEDRESKEARIAQRAKMEEHNNPTIVVRDDRGDRALTKSFSKNFEHDRELKKDAKEESKPKSGSYIQPAASSPLSEPKSDSADKKPSSKPTTPTTETPPPLSGSSSKFLNFLSPRVTAASEVTHTKDDASLAKPAESGTSSASKKKNPWRLSLGFASRASANAGSDPVTSEVTSDKKPNTSKNQTTTTDTFLISGIPITDENFYFVKPKYANLLSIIKSDDFISSSTGHLNQVLNTLPKESLDKNSKQIINWLIREKVIMHTIEEIVSYEIERTTSIGTVLRLNNYASKLMTTHTIVLGSEWLEKVLKPVIIECCEYIDNPALEFELDPNRAADPSIALMDAASDPKTQEKVQANIKNLKVVCEKVMEAISKGLQTLPEEMLVICQILARKAEKQFSNDKNHRYIVVGGYLFLRFIGPVIVLPDKFLGLQVTPKSRATLTKVSKVIQQVANGVPYGNKEAFMVPMNDFVKDHTEQLRKDVDRIVDLETELKKEEREEDLKNGEILENGWMWHNILYETIPKMEEVIGEAEAKRNEDREEWKQVKELLEVLGDPKTLNSRAFALNKKKD
eukprot:TRINITY_DN10989_c0_g1_i2.p1 TRINITY_DN10989_c0_g1~~TRINITY_DN10989_c0_g1_i2.p1  ORF type:complete len:705 (+),score=195.95 TRINITY_DN10989_c0_g1_i2:85-2199(+)